MLTQILSFEVTNEADANLLLALAQRLGLKVTKPLSAEEQAQRFRQIAGAWQSEESGDELNQQLREARTFRDRDADEA